jgi:hypothetical protein
MKTLMMTTALSAIGALMTVDATPARSAEFVYVESNIQSPNGNSIFAFQRNADRSLSPVAGSPFPAGGAWVQYTGFVFGPYDSDQDLVVDPGKRLLFAVNSGSDTIAAFHIASDGSLKAIPGRPFRFPTARPVEVHKNYL